MSKMSALTEVCQLEPKVLKHNMYMKRFHIIFLKFLVAFLDSRKYEHEAIMNMKNLHSTSIFAVSIGLICQKRPNSNRYNKILKL